MSVSLLLACSVMGHAETVTRKEAQRLAQTFFNEMYGRVMSAPAFAYGGKDLTTDRLFTPFYIFNHPAGGYVVIAADNKAYPILAYSREGAFAQDKMDASLKEWLRNVARNIELVRYDSRVPYEAISQWIDLNATVHKTLHADLRVAPARYTAEQARQAIEASLDRGEDAALMSDVYTPEQWADEIARQLQHDGQTPIAVLKGADAYTATIDGVAGDYFAIRFGQGQQMLCRLLPTETLSFGEYALLGTPSYSEPTPEAERPFAFFEQEIAPMAVADSGITLTPDHPVTDHIGDGHFMITLPLADVDHAEVYSLSGRPVQTRKYGATRSAAIDLTAQPHGFYVALLTDAEGRTYGFKLMR